MEKIIKLKRRKQQRHYPSLSQMHNRWLCNPRKHTHSTTSEKTSPKANDSHGMLVTPSSPPEVLLSSTIAVGSSRLLWDKLMMISTSLPMYVSFGSRISTTSTSRKSHISKWERRLNHNNKKIGVCQWHFKFSGFFFHSKSWFCCQ